MSDARTGAASSKETHWPSWTAAGALLAVASLLFFLAGRPPTTDDLWWHLSHGRAFAAEGLWLDEDPTLFTSRGGPVPASWLSDVLLHGTETAFGLVGLRVLHVGLLALLIAGSWCAYRRASGLGVVASFATLLFLVVSDYRLDQLRPELFTLAASIALTLLLVLSREPPSWRRVGGAALLCGLWANLHPGFLLGPGLIGCACAGSIAEGLLRGPRRPPAGHGRSLRLAGAAVLAAVMTLLNPMGPEAHVLYFASGSEAPAMNIVSDEWSPLALLRLPVENVPPSLLAWLVYWLVLSASCWAVVRVYARWRDVGTVGTGYDGRTEAVDAVEPGVDGPLIALAVFGLIAPLFAVRFLWLLFFPLLLVARVLADVTRERPARLGAVALLALVCVPAYWRLGDWPLLSRGVTLESYCDAYDRWKYHGHSVGFLRDAHLEGHLFNSYFMGGFLGYQLAPRMQVFIDGSLNVSPDVMNDYFTLQSRGLLPAGRLPENTPDAAKGVPVELQSLLDRYEVDVWLGIGFPTPPLPNRPWRFTARHLEHEPGWLLAFRSMQSAVYLRRNERNARNLERLEAYYRNRGVPFDRMTGLDVGLVVDEAPEWAVEHGLVPVDYEALVDRNDRTIRPHAALARLSMAYLAIGLESRALEIDARFVRVQPAATAPRRRRVGALLRLGRVEEALREAAELESLGPRDRLSIRLIEEAKRHADLTPEARRAELALLPTLTRGEALVLRATRSVAPPLRPRASPRAESAAGEGDSRSDRSPLNGARAR